MDVHPDSPWVYTQHKTRQWKLRKDPVQQTHSRTWLCGADSIRGKGKKSKEWMGCARIWSCEFSLSISGWMSSEVRNTMFWKTVAVTDLWLLILSSLLCVLTDSRCQVTPCEFSVARAPTTTRRAGDEFQRVTEGMERVSNVEWTWSGGLEGFHKGNGKAQDVLHRGVKLSVDASLSSVCPSVPMAITPWRAFFTVSMGTVMQSVNSSNDNASHNHRKEDPPKTIEALEDLEVPISEGPPENGITNQVFCQ